MDRYRFRPWLDLSEAASFLSRGRERVQESDLLRFGLDGILELSVSLPAPVPAQYVSGERDGKPIFTTTQVRGIWNLPAEGDNVSELEHLYHRARGLGYVDVPTPKHGATICRKNEVCYLRPDPGSSSGMWPRRASVLPTGTLIVIPMPELQRFASLHLEPVKQAIDPAPAEKPLGTRERNVLLAIIAGLAAEAKIDIGTPVKAAAVVAASIERLGGEVSERAIVNHLKAAKEAINR